MGSRGGDVWLMGELWIGEDTAFGAEVSMGGDGCEFKMMGWKS